MKIRPVSVVALSVVFLMAGQLIAARVPGSSGDTHLTVGISWDHIVFVDCNPITPTLYHLTSSFEIGGHSIVFAPIASHNSLSITTIHTNEPSS